MSTPALLGLLAGIALLALVVWLILRWDSSVPDTEEIEDATQRLKWTQLAKDAQDDFGLADIRDSGGKWAASIAALLGVLSTVAIVAGPDALVDDVGGAEATVAAALVLGAAGVATIAMLLGALAEQGTPIPTTNEGDVYRTILKTRAERAVIQLRWSRILTGIAVLMIGSAAAVAWLTPLTGKSEPDSQDALVVGSSGTKCGTLTGASGAVSLSVDGTDEAIPAGALVTLVDSCPGE